MEYENMEKLEQIPEIASEIGINFAVF